MLSRRLTSLRSGLLSLVSILVLLISPVPVIGEVIEPPERPFPLPFNTEPGVNTWLLGQTYGNTQSAYRMREVTYGRSQGIHFGIDLSAPCGTEVVALADGVVFVVDELRFGSPPHNLIIDYPELGYASLYGHLLEPPNLTPGQKVRQGEVIALTGDPAETCHGRPHLHLEIRDLKTHARKYNPLLLIDADWDTLSSIGSFGTGFQYNLEEPRQWQTLFDQPEAVSGGPLLNEFDNPWPPVSPTLPDQTYFVASAADPNPQSSLRRLTDGGCCAQPAWSADSTRVRFIDRPETNSPAGIWEVNATQAEPAPQMFAEGVTFYSNNFTYRMSIDGRVTHLERVDDGTTSTIPTGGRPVSVSPGGTRVLWQVPNSENASPERRVLEIRTAKPDGTEVRSVMKAPRGGFAGWISDDAILVSGRDSLPAREDVLTAVSLATGAKTELVRVERLRGAALSRGGTWLAYYVAFNDDKSLNGLWVVKTDGTVRHHLSPDLFGSYRWRDDGRLLVLPFTPGAESHKIVEFDPATGTTRSLTDPSSLKFKITNNDWTVSPDGRKVAFVNSADNNIWLLTLMD